MPRKKSTRVRWRLGGKWVPELCESATAWGDFRDFADVGGKQEALRPEGSKQATDDQNVAAKLASDRVAQLKAKRDRRGLGIEEKEPAPQLSHYAEYHLLQKKRDRECTDTWIAASEHHLERACAYFGEDRPLDRIDPEDLTAWVNHLRKQPGRRGRMLTETTIRKMLNSLSNLYARTVSEKRTTGVTANPVAEMFSKPTPDHEKARHLQPEDAAILLESARTYRADADQGAFRFMYPLLATFLLTGGRRSEILGLAVEDVSLSLGRIYIRPNQWRRLKTKGSARTVPLWPQLRTILEQYFADREREGGLGSGLLFPAVVSEQERKKAAKAGRTPPELMLVDLRKPVTKIAERAGFSEPVLLHSLRHTYTAARIQTCDQGRPVQIYTVARELGHTSTAMIERVYGHLHHRVQAGDPEGVEFRVEHHRDKLAPRLEVLARR